MACWQIKSNDLKSADEGRVCLSWSRWLERGTFVTPEPGERLEKPHWTLVCSVRSGHRPSRGAPPVTPWGQDSHRFGAIWFPGNPNKIPFPVNYAWSVTSKEASAFSFLLNPVSFQYKERGRRGGRAPLLFPKVQQWTGPWWVPLSKWKRSPDPLDSLESPSCSDFIPSFWFSLYFTKGGKTGGGLCVPFPSPSCQYHGVKNDRVFLPKVLA